MNVTLTPRAESFMNRMIRMSGAANAGFRLVVSPGGCSGFNSSFTVENAPLEGDAVLESNGVKVFLPAESRILLEGITVDFADTPTSTGLVFINPQAQPCACKSSGTPAGMGAVATTVSISSIQRRH